MQCEGLTIPFVDKTSGSTIYEAELSGAEQVAVAVNVTSISGSPTSFRFHAYLMAADTALITVTLPFGVRRSAELTNVGGAYLGQITGSAVEPAFENSYSKVRVTTVITGGTSPKISGNLYIFKKRR